MTVEVLYFGIVREKLGRRGDTVECPDGASVAWLLAYLAEREQIFAIGAGALRVAVNREYVPESHCLASGDEVAIIPPVAGGVDVSDR